MPSEMSKKRPRLKHQSKQPDILDPVPQHWHWTRNKGDDQFVLSDDEQSSEEAPPGEPSDPPTDSETPPSPAGKRKMEDNSGSGVETTKKPCIQDPV